MNITEFRTKHPEYNDIDDNTLSKRLYEKYYSDISYPDFLGKFSVTSPESPHQAVQIEPQGASVAAPAATSKIPAQITPEMITPGQGRADSGPYPELIQTAQPAEPSEPPRQQPFQPTESTISALPKKGKMAKILSWFQPFPSPISTREAPIEKLGRILSPIENVIEKAVTGSQVPKLLWYGISKVRPDLADKPWQETLNELSPYEQKGVSKSVGEVAEFVSEIKTAGKVLKTVGWTSPMGKRLIDRIARNAPVWMASGAINELVNGVVQEKDAPEIANAVAKQTLIRGGESIVWSGVEFGAGKAFAWALKKFPRFRMGWEKWAKGKKTAETRAARKEVDEALRIYKDTGDRTQWDAVRIKYAGITPEGVERIKRRGIPSTEAKVKDFGQYPIVKTGITPQAPAAPSARPGVAPVSKPPAEAPTVPPQTPEAVTAPPTAPEGKVVAKPTLAEGEIIKLIDQVSYKYDVILDPDRPPEQSMGGDMEQERPGFIVGTKDAMNEEILAAMFHEIGHLAEYAEGTRDVLKPLGARDAKELTAWQEGIELARESGFNITPELIKKINPAYTKYIKHLNFTPTTDAKNDKPHPPTAPEGDVAKKI